LGEKIKEDKTKCVLFVVGVIALLVGMYWVVVPKTWMGQDGLLRVEWVLSDRVCVAMPHDQSCQFPLMYEGGGNQQAVLILQGVDSLSFLFFKNIISPSQI
jgi:hypothetical protein